MSPVIIVTGTGKPDCNNMRIEFGAYDQVCEDCKPTNNPRARSMAAIVLGPTDNAQGDYYFISLTTGARIPTQMG